MEKLLHVLSIACHLLVLDYETILKFRTKQKRLKKKEKIKRMNCLPENLHFTKLRAEHITNTNKNSAQPFWRIAQWFETDWHYWNCHFFVSIAIIYVFKFIWRQRIAAFFYEWKLECCFFLSYELKIRWKRQTRHYFSRGIFNSIFVSYFPVYLLICVPCSLTWCMR